METDQRDSGARERDLRTDRPYRSTSESDSEVLVYGVSLMYFSMVKRWANIIRIKRSKRKK
jgi:hypothetical protein